MPVSWKVVIARGKHFVKHIVHRFHQGMSCSMIGGQIHMPFDTSFQSFIGDARQSTHILFAERNEGMRRRLLT